MVFRIQMKTIVKGLLILVVFLWGGCAGLGTPIDAPQVRLADIQLHEMRAFESTFKIQLRVINANDIPIVISGISCDLDINEQRFASGVSNQRVEIPSYGTEIVSMVVYSSVIDIVRGVLSFQNRENLTYRLKGKVRLDAGALAPSVLPFNAEGALSPEGLMNQT
jgi:LEA14-like dessication related protein